jgi:hypothetical protein
MLDTYCKPNTGGPGTQTFLGKFQGNIPGQINFDKNNITV